MEVWLNLEGERVTQSSFITDGCATSMACGSAAAYLTQNKSLGEIHQLRPIDVLETLGDPNNTEAHHCAELALATFAKALAEYEKAKQVAAARGSECAEGCAHPDCCESCEEPASGETRDATAPHHGIGQV